MTVQSAAPSHRERTGLVSPHARGQTRRVRAAGRTPPAGTNRFKPLPRHPRGGGDRQVGAAGLPRRSGVAIPGGAGGRRPGGGRTSLAGLHQLCTPLLDRLGAIPTPQREALGTAFGLRAGPPPGPLPARPGRAEPAGRGSSRAPAAVRRRRRPVARSGIRRRPSPSWRAGWSRNPSCWFFAVREPADEQAIAGLPQLVLGGLSAADARELLASAIPGPLDHRVRDRVVEETRGNPLALLELPRGLRPARTGRRFGISGTPGLAGQIEESFGRRLARVARRPAPPDAARRRRPARRPGARARGSASARRRRRHGGPRGVRRPAAPRRPGHVPPPARPFGDLPAGAGAGTAARPTARWPS